ncbi:hypothetical protein ACFODO_07555 [Acinetobacter sichuanensis]|uniref:Uncharacterized protein n=1 Tax=Acinetobacter sichuanensis TaxID=2136183 RepID=A0ABV7BE99_9GAMM
MATTNNHLTLIDQVGGIEKAKAIVDGAPEWASSYCKDSSEYYSVHDDFECCYNLSNLRTAIAQHESNNHQETSHCNNSGNCEKRFNSSEVIKQLESDQITDIRNHISPNTKVVEL